jgi:hypothetical protein
MTHDDALCGCTFADKLESKFADLVATAKYAHSTGRDRSTSAGLNREGAGRTFGNSCVASFLTGQKHQVCVHSRYY